MILKRDTPSVQKWQKQLLIFSVVLITAFIAGEILPPYSTSSNSLVPPSSEYWLGTNDIGQDVFIGTLKALPNTVFIALLASVFSLSLAIILASFAAIRGGFVSTLILRWVDMLQVIPSILIMILFAAWFQPDFFGVILLMTMLMWYDDIRVLRTIFLRELTRENVHYARNMGAGWAYCLHRHILPSVWPSLIGLLIQQLRKCTMKVAGLGFLGLSDPNLITWGSLMRDALEYLQSAALLWLLLPPGISLSAFLFFILAVGQNLEQISMAE